MTGTLNKETRTFNQESLVHRDQKNLHKIWSQLMIEL